MPGHELFFFARSHEVFANDAGMVNPAHCLRRSDVAICFFLATDS